MLATAFSVHDPYHAYVTDPLEPGMMTKCHLAKGIQIFIILTSLVVLSVPALVVLIASKGSDCQIVHGGTDYVVVRRPKILMLVVLSLIFFFTQAPTLT